MKVNVEKAKELLAQHHEFTGNSFTAERNKPFRRGLLPEDEYAQLLMDEPSYIVYSYETPIAWVRGDCSVYVPTVTYSATTTRHQRIARAYL